jgi:cytoskeletal protein RodZ
MDPIEIQEKKRAAQQRLRAQRAKAGELRGRVVAISLICFVLLWGIVFVQMATGNDPVLGDSSSPTAKSSGHRHRARQTVESNASTDSEEPGTSGAGEPEVEQFSEEPAEEEFVEPEEEFSEEEVEAEPVEEEFVEEPVPVTTSQS